MRANKFLVSLGAARSRAHADLLLSAGRVTLTPTGPVLALGTRITSANAQLFLDSKPLPLPTTAPHVYIALHKPPGYLTAWSTEEEARPTLDDALRLMTGTPPDTQGRKLFYAGRLDYESEGLVLLSTDGDWVQKISHPRHGCLKKYAVEARYVGEEAAGGGTAGANLLAASLATRLKHGVKLTEDPRDAGTPSASTSTSPARSAKALNARVLEVDEGVGGAPTARIEVDLQEGRKRVVRRMFDALGWEVTQLVRTRVGGVDLSGLGAGAWRAVTEEGALGK
jgi:23S rRNA pseudouridine2605 synthase